MDHFIEGKLVTQDDIGSAVTYIPNHAKGDVNHKDCERGVLSSFNDHTVFVRFKAPNGASCKTDNLVWG